MKKLKQDILRCLEEVKGSGSFASSHTAGFVFPGLEVDGFGEIAFPVNRLQAEALISAAHQAPFGKGMQTLVDTKVRSAWEIDADRLEFRNPGWADFLNSIIRNIKSDLGLENYSLKASLYKLLIYEKGDFFLPHKDSEKEKGMFGSLIIGLPSNHTGGELVISFEGTKKTIDFAVANSSYAIKYAAFYADCDHEVKPLSSGYRVCLVYNLIQEKVGESIAAQSVQNHAQKLARHFSEAEARNNKSPFVILLGHQYTPTNFSREMLKLNDRAKAEVLLQAAKLKGYYAKLCLTTSYIMGSPEYNSYGYSYDNGEAEEMVMGEVIEEDLLIEHWANDGLPGFDPIPLEEDELITSFALEEGEPLVKENTGYMGNYGPDLMYWYHYAAVMIWSPEENARILLSQSTGPQLRWIEYFAEANDVSNQEILAVEQVLRTGFHSNRFAEDSEDFKVVASWLLKYKQEAFLLTLSSERLQFFFACIDASHWIQLFDNLPADDIRSLLGKASQKVNRPVLQKTIGILKAALDRAQLKPVAMEQMPQLPGQLREIYSKEKQGIEAEALRDLLWLSKHIPEQFPHEEIAEALAIGMDRTNDRRMIIAQVLASEERSELSDLLMTTCLSFLRDLARNKPEPPPNWRRPVPRSTSYREQWQILKAFLQSPDEYVFDFSRKQQERSVMQAAIQSLSMDLKTETIKKGSPHTLRITKTQDAYERDLKEWNKDMLLLERLEGKEDTLKT